MSRVEEVARPERQTDGATSELTGLGDFLNISPPTSEARAGEANLVTVMRQRDHSAET